MARILDFYAVRWEYEPHTFPILWNLDGDVVESFSPDFYLPDLDLYLEMTTLRQKLVRKKNRKLRRLRELYPDVNIKLFYARDFRALMLKYGKLALVDGLSGIVRARWPLPHGDGRGGRAGRSTAGARRGPIVGRRRVPRRPRPSATAGSGATSPRPARRRAAARRPRRRRDGGRGDERRASSTSRRHRRDPPDRGADRGQGRRARRADQRRLRRPPADPRVACSRARCRSWPTSCGPSTCPLRIDLMEVSSYGGSDDRVVRPGPDPQGPVREHRGRGRPHRRGHHRHRADAQLPDPLPARQEPGARSASARCSTSRPGGSSRSRSTTSGSRSRTSSSSATASTTASSTATCGSSASSSPRSTARREPEAATRDDASPARSGGGRTLAAIAGPGHPRRLRPAVVAASAARAGLPPPSGNAFEGSGILVFLVGVATLALVALPYAAGDRPLGLDRWLSFALARGRRLARLRLARHRPLRLGAFQFGDPLDVFTNGPGLWVTGIGLAILSRAAYRMTREPHYR